MNTQSLQSYFYSYSLKSDTLIPDTLTSDFQSFNKVVAFQLHQDIDSLFKYIELPSPLKEACHYAMTGGGKRVRPLLVASSCISVISVRDVNNISNMAQLTSDVRRAMLAVELLHAYSLVHDDLPCMDDDALRRGRATTHIKFGDATALLVGDVLQSLAFEVLSTEFSSFSADFQPVFKPIEKLLSAELISIFAPRARRMVSGQMLDLEGENQSETPLIQEELESIHCDKTGALIEASVLMGAICAQSSTIGSEVFQLEITKLNTNQLQALEIFAKKIGLAFQVQDDILDVTADTEQLGKPSGSDEKLDKSTYVKLMGIDNAKEYAKNLFTEGKQALSLFKKESMLVQLASWLWQRQS